MEPQTEAWNQNKAQPNFDNPDKGSVQRTDPMGKAHADARATPHPVVGDQDQFKDSGKDISQVNPPIVSINPSSGKTVDDGKEQEIKVFDKPNRYLNHVGQKHDFMYPFEDMNIGQGFFIPVAKGSTTDKLMARINHQIAMFRKQTSECEKDENGDDVWESIVIQTKKRKDHVIQLEPDGKPIVGANQTNRPKLIYSANFIARPVVAGDEYAEGQKAEGDGVLVVRVI